MDPNSMVFMVVVGGAIGAVLGVILTGDGFGWLLNAIVGALGAVLGAHILGTSQIDMGPIMNVMMAAAGVSITTAMMLRT